MHGDVKIYGQDGVSNFFHEQIVSRIPGIPSEVGKYLAGVLAVPAATSFFQMPGGVATTEEKMLQYRNIAELCTRVMVLEPRRAMAQRRGRGYMRAGQVGYREAALMAALLHNDPKTYCYIGDNYPDLVKGAAAIINAAPIIAVLGTGRGQAVVYNYGYEDAMHATSYSGVGSGDGKTPFLRRQEEFLWQQINDISEKP